MILGLNLNHDYALCKLTESNLHLLEFERISRIRNHWIEPECYSLAILDDFNTCEIKKIELICLNSPKLRSIKANNGNLSSNIHHYVFDGEYPSITGHDHHPNGVVNFRGFQIPAVWISHYHAHAASGYYTSSFTEADILCLDGGGDFGFGAIFEAKMEKITLIERLIDWNFGFSYNAFSRNQLAKQGFHEGKIMAMASYGKPENYLNPIFTMNGKLRQIKFPVSVHGVAKMQQEFEQSVIKLLEMKTNRNQNLICTGGCFLNVQLNRKIAESGLYDRIYIPPYVGDMGTAIGSALIGSQLIGRKLPPLKVLQSPFLGNDMHATKQIIEQKIQKINFD
jgi:predicted NodU family carbamoyl transferase